MPGMQSRIARMLVGDHQRASAAWRWFGIRLVEAEPGRTVCEMTASEEMRNHQGVCHGGCLSALADSAMGAALATVLPEGERHMSFDLKLTFLRPVEVGQTVRAAGSVLHSGRRTAVGEAVHTVDWDAIATPSPRFIVYLP